MEYQWDPNNPLTYNNRTGQYKYQVEFNFIQKQIKNAREKLLDVGGGAGRFALPLAEIFNKVVIIDPSSDALQILKSRIVSDHIVLHHGTLDDYQGEGEFDIVLIIEVLGYIKDLNSFFKVLFSLTHPDSRIILTVTNPQSWRFMIKKIFSLFGRKYYNYNFHQIAEIEQFLSKAGFEVEEKLGFNWIPLPLTSNSRLVGFFAFLERKTGIGRWIRQSPWVIISANRVIK